ncbi:MAG TPA: efflux transporter periplasmic adaptor subunit, partial [Gammaproteobacteria bacterium]|nr:efflux transporter periplasmic adaptor subunit [Gammaproteobacteria bacterium]
QAPATRQVVVVPSQAVAAAGETGTIFVLNDDQLERRAVRLGGRLPDGGQIVLSGLSAGTRLAVADFSLLEDGARVRVEEPAQAL